MRVCVCLCMFKRGCCIDANNSKKILGQSKYFLSIYKAKSQNELARKKKLGKIYNSMLLERLI